MNDLIKSDSHYFNRIYQEMDKYVVFHNSNPTHWFNTDIERSFCSP